MSISARATAKIQPLPQEDRPISEEYRIAAKAWVEAEAAAHLLEETKTAVLAQMMAGKGDIPVNRAEQLVKASPEWKEHLVQMVDARKQANLAKVRMKYIEMRFSEWQSNAANQRAERRMT